MRRRKTEKSDARTAYEPFHMTCFDFAFSIGYDGFANLNVWAQIEIHEAT